MVRQVMAGRSSTGAHRYHQCSADFFVPGWRALEDSNLVLPFFKSALYATSAVPCHAQYRTGIK